MQDQPLTIRSWPQAILHLDADAFFASCEQAIHPELKGKPVITGKERGIVAAASYEAKARGIKRAIGLIDAKRICPDVIALPSDYETYSLFSVRMFEIYFRKLKNMSDNDVIFTGFVPDKLLPQYFAACDVYVTASLWEGFNLPAAEAQACGKRVVAFDIGPHSEIVKKGVLVKKENTKEFAEAVIKLLR